MRHLVLRREDVVILDMEAGVEHMGRGTAGSVDAFVIVVEPGLRSLGTAEQIRGLATEIGIKQIYLVANKVRSPEDEAFVRSHAGGLPVLGSLPYTSGEVYSVRTQTFADAFISHWAWQWIERLYNAGITGGCGSAPLIYCPDSSVTRAQMAIFLERGMNGSAFVPPTGTGLVFGDVPGTYWAMSWIERLAADGITAGCGGGNYCPESPVTRAQMAIFLLRAKHGSGYAPPGATGNMFTDAPSTYWAVNWIEQLATEGITGGCGPGLYCPDNPVTRAQMAVFLVRTFSLP